MNPDYFPCQHPRTEENKIRHGNGTKCKTCRRAIELKSQRKIRATKRGKEV